MCDEAKIAELEKRIEGLQTDLTKTNNLLNEIQDQLAKILITKKVLTDQIGINTPEPQKALHVIGDVQVDGILTATLAPNLVGPEQIVSNAVNAAKIQDGSIGTDELDDNAVTAAKLADDAVNAAKIQDGSIGTDELDDNAVTAAKIHDESVDTNKLANEAITKAKLHKSLQQEINQLQTKTAKINSTDKGSGGIILNGLRIYSELGSKEDNRYLSMYHLDESLLGLKVGGLFVSPEYESENPKKGDLYVSGEIQGKLSYSDPKKYTFKGGQVTKYELGDTRKGFPVILSGFDHIKSVSKNNGKWVIAAEGITERVDRERGYEERYYDVSVTVIFVGRP